MPSAQDFLDSLNEANQKLNGVNDRLDQVNGKLDFIAQSVQNVNLTLQWGFTQLIKIGNYTNLALSHNAAQNDTIICILEHISRNTCELLNEAHTQTGLQKTIEINTSTLAELYSVTHAEAALIRDREQALKKQIEECCPPRQPGRPCSYQPWPEPGTLPYPPTIDPNPPGGPIL